DVETLVPGESEECQLTLTSVSQANDNGEWGIAAAFMRSAGGRSPFLICNHQSACFCWMRGTVDGFRRRFRRHGASPAAADHVAKRYNGGRFSKLFMARNSLQVLGVTRLCPTVSIPARN